jgi:hypothetical protein
MKKTITICDVCEENEVDKRSKKCQICGGDVCDDCMESLTFSSMHSEEYFEIEMCGNCNEHMSKLPKKDMKEIAGKVFDILEPFLKSAIVMEGLKTKSK